MKSIATTRWVAVVLVGLAGCAGSSNVGDAGMPDGDDVAAAPPVISTEFCPQLGDAYCAAVLACCTDPMWRWSSPSSCAASLGGACEMQLGPSLADARTAYNAVRGGGYVARVRSVVSGCGTSLGYPNDVADLFDGTVGVGGSCDPAGGADPAAFFSCLRGLACDPATYSCQPLHSSGGPCPCELSLACVSGTCQPPLVDGASCVPPGFTATCQSGFCDPNCYACRVPSANDVYCVPHGGSTC